MRATAIGQRILEELRDVTLDVELEKAIRRWLAGDDAFCRSNDGFALVSTLERSLQRMGALKQK